MNVKTHNLKQLLHEKKITPKSGGMVHISNHIKAVRNSDTNYRNRKINSANDFIEAAVTVCRVTLAGKSSGEVGKDLYTESLSRQTLALCQTIRSIRCDRNKNRSRCMCIHSHRK